MKEVYNVNSLSAKNEVAKIEFFSRLILRNKIFLSPQFLYFYPYTIQIQGDRLITPTPRMKFGTKAVHAGMRPDPSTGAIMTPVYMTSTYVQAGPGDHKGYEYGRSKNPTRTALQKSIAELEGGKHSLVFSSGMAAADVVMKLLKPGDHVLSGSDLYGGSYRMFTQVYAPMGIEFEFIDLAFPEKLEALIRPKTKMLWLETPTNPLMTVYDIEAICAVAKKHNVIVIVDNTFATPYLQHPLELGADIVVHSITKYLGGHSDLLMGAVVTNELELQERMAFFQNSCGAVPGPMDCFLVLRGLKTLHLRMERHCHNARKIAQWLENHRAISKVYYPGLKSHATHDIAQKQMKDFGGMLAFTLHGDRLQDAVKMMQGTQLFSLAESLGGVESLIGHPATMTHAAIPKADREKIGLKDSLIRVSVGVEEVEDLIEDLNTAINNLKI